MKRQTPSRRDRMQVYLWQNTEEKDDKLPTITGRKNPVKNVNKLLKTECGITEKLEPLEAANGGEFAPTYRFFSMTLQGV